MKIASSYVFVQLLVNHIVYFTFELPVLAQVWILVGLILLASVVYFVTLRWGEKQERPVEVYTN